MALHTEGGCSYFGGNLAKQPDAHNISVAEAIAIQSFARRPHFVGHREGEAKYLHDTLQLLIIARDCATPHPRFLWLGFWALCGTPAWLRIAGRHRPSTRRRVRRGVRNSACPAKPALW